MKALVVIAAGALALTSVGGAATVPYRWTPAQAAKQLVAWQPAAWPRELGDVTLTSARCAGKGSPVNGRFLAFECSVGGKRMGFTNRTPTARWFVKVRRQGKGQPCVAATMAGIPRGCLSAAGARKVGSVEAAADAAEAKMRAANPEWQGVNVWCQGYGAGFYTCNTGTDSQRFAAVAFSPTKVSVTLL